MKKINILVATAVAGAFLSGCAEFKLPDLPKTEKQKQKSQKELTETECKKIVKQYRLDEVPNTTERYKKLKSDALYCQFEYNL